MDELLRGLIAGDADEEDEAPGLGALGAILAGMSGGGQAPSRGGLADLLGALGGAGQMAETPSPAGGGIADLLSALGGAGEMPEAPSAAGGGLADLLGALGGGGEMAEAPSPAGGGIADLLGALGGAGEMAETPSAGGGIADLLGALGGGGGLGGLLGGLLGGGAQSAEGMPGLNASPAMGGIADALAKKLGVSPAVAAMIVSAAMAILMQALQKRATERQGLPPSADVMTGGPDLGDLLKGLGGRGQFNADQFRSVDATAQLAAQAGIDQETASEGVAEALRMLGGQFGGIQ